MVRGWNYTRAKRFMSRRLFGRPRCVRERADEILSTRAVSATAGFTAITVRRKRRIARARRTEYADQQDTRTHTDQRSMCGIGFEAVGRFNHLLAREIGS